MMLPEHLASKIDRDAAGGCWLWTASRDHNGYGKACVGRRVLGAHRVVYEALLGPVPDGRELDHLCRNPQCVNPDHLEPVTHRENILRGATFGAANAAKVMCPKGHPYDRRDGDRRRRCSVCRREQEKARQVRRRVAA